MQSHKGHLSDEDDIGFIRASDWLQSGIRIASEWHQNGIRIASE